MAAILKCDVLPASTITIDALSRYKYISMVQPPLATEFKITVVSLNNLKIEYNYHLILNGCTFGTSLPSLVVAVHIRGGWTAIT